MTVRKEEKEECVSSGGCVRSKVISLGYIRSWEQIVGAQHFEIWITLSSLQQIMMFWTKTENDGILNCLDYLEHGNLLTTCPEWSHLIMQADCAPPNVWADYEVLTVPFKVDWCILGISACVGRRTSLRLFPKVQWVLDRYSSDSTTKHACMMFLKLLKFTRGPN